MRRIAPFLVVAAAAALAVGGGEGVGQSQARIVYRVSKPPKPLAVTRACHFKNWVWQMSSPAGAKLGTARECIVRSTPVTQNGLIIVYEQGRLIHTFAGGTIEARVEFTYRFNRANTAARFEAVGTVIRATGRYRGRRGDLEGDGTIRYTAQGVPQPKLTFVVGLS